MLDQDGISGCVLVNLQEQGQGGIRQGRALHSFSHNGLCIRGAPPALRVKKEQSLRLDLGGAPPPKRGGGYPYRHT